MGIRAETIEVRRVVAVCDLCDWSEAVQARVPRGGAGFLERHHTIWEGQGEGRTFDEKTVFVRGPTDNGYAPKQLMLCHVCTSGRLEKAIHLASPLSQEVLERVTSAQAEPERKCCECEYSANGLDEGPCLACTRQGVHESPELRGSDLVKEKLERECATCRYRGDRDIPCFKCEDLAMWAPHLVEKKPK